MTERNWRQENSSFFCVNGHGNHFPGVDPVKKELEKTKNELLIAQRHVSTLEDQILKLSKKKKRAKK